MHEQLDNVAAKVAAGEIHGRDPGFSADALRESAIVALREFGFPITEENVLGIVGEVRRIRGETEMVTLTPAQVLRASSLVPPPMAKAEVISPRFLQTFPGAAKFAELTREQTYTVHEEAAQRAFPNGNGTH